MGKSFSDADTGWSFTVETDAADPDKAEVGLAVMDVQHDGHNFGKDLRCVGVRITVEEVAPGDTVVSTATDFYWLASRDFTVGNIQELKPKSIKNPYLKGATFKYLAEADNALYLSGYFEDGVNHVAYGARADYTWSSGLISARWSNADFDGLTISEIFLFSRYGSSPAHEPGGVLNAARFHPMIKYEIKFSNSVDKKKNYFRIAAFRFDYRLGLNIDRHYDVKKNAALTQLGNNAGLFRDTDAGWLPTAIGGIFSGVASAARRSTRKSVTKTAFEATEKPLILEVATVGLMKGFSQFVDSNKDLHHCWDNVHWWGAQGKGNDMISAPGAFHAAHCHWRWGSTGLYLVRWWKKEIDTTGMPSAAEDSPWAGGIRGGLVDPHAWIQTIRIGVTKNEWDPQVTFSEDMCPPSWDDLFTNLRSDPEDIEAGDTIVLWYSTKSERKITIPLAGDPFQNIPSSSPQYYGVFTWGGSGTVFIHGMFFGHEAESSKFFKVGTRDPEHWPTSAKTIRKQKLWLRTAD